MISARAQAMLSKSSFIVALSGLILTAAVASADAPPAAIVRQIAPLSIRGVNYFPRETPWGGLWTKTPAEVFQRDMALAASLNINTVRTFLQFSAHIEQASLAQADGSPTPAYFEKIDALLSAAWHNDIRVILCFEFSPQWLAAPARWKQAVSCILNKYRDDGRILLWDVMNEPDDEPKWTDATRAYLADAIPLIKKLDPNHPSTVGLAFRIDRVATVGLGDILQYHEYCPKTDLFVKGPARVTQSIKSQWKAGQNRPLLIGEFGMSTARDPEHGAAADLLPKIAAAPGTEAEQARLYQMILTAAEQNHIVGVMPWCLHDYPIKNPNESHFGLVRPDGSLKPAAALLKETYARWRDGAKAADHIGAEYGQYTAPADRAVNAAAKDALLLPLAGQWQCALDPDQKGIDEKWFSKQLDDKTIALPGTLDEAGIGQGGDAPTLRALSRRFTYIGPAWYQREITIPADWAAKRVTLTLERVMWESRVWIDDQPLGARDSLCTAHIYDLANRLSPGQHRITIRVDNSGRPGANSHGYGDDEQIRWNGLLGRLELRAQDPVCIGDVRICPDLPNRRAIVHVAVNSIAAESFDGTITVTATPRNGKSLPPARANFKIASGPLPVQIDLPLGDAPALWDEFSPTLYDARIDLAAASGKTKCADRAVASFGQRDLSHRGAQLLINGRACFLRGTHDGGGFPLTGHPAMDVESWRKIFKTCREFGLNHVRYHSFCPPDAAFTAADEEGIILLAELPFWGHVARDGSAAAFLRAELLRILDAYGNHPSFCMMSMGNEHSGDWDVLGGFVDEGRRHDPRRLYAAASNQYIRMGKNPQPINPGDQFAVIMRGPPAEAGYETGRIRCMERFMNGEAPAFDADYRDILAGFDVPTFAHELGQWWVFPDVNESAKYTGVLRSGAMDLFKTSLSNANLLDRAAAFHQAGGALAVKLYKEDIERQLRTPGLGGFQLLDLHDYSGQNTSLVGLLDAFWESKGIVSPAEFRRFCAPTVVLSRLPRVLWTSDQTLAAPIEIAHYGPADLARITPAWKLIAADGRVAAAGNLPRQDRIPTGQTTALGILSLPLRDLPAPAQYRLEVAAGDAVNDWNIWVYPPDSAEISAPANVRVTDQLDAPAMAHLEAGGRVLFLGHAAAHALPVDFPTPVWNPWIGGGIRTCGLLIDAAHPALAQFPTAAHADWQWRDLLEPEARAFVLNDLPPEYNPIAAVIDEPLRAFRMAVLVEARVGNGVILASSVDLNSSLGGRQLRRSLLAYLGSNRCQPALSLTPDQAVALLVANRFRLIDAPPANLQPLLDVEPSVNAPPTTPASWKPAYDRIVTQTPGFGYDFPPHRFDPWKKIPDVTWKKNNHPAWMTRDGVLRLHAPPNFTGTAYLHFQDADSGKALAAVQSSNDGCYIGAHAGQGRWIALRTTPADLKDGVIDLHVYKPAGGDSWSRAPRITRLIIAPPP